MQTTKIYIKKRKPEARRKYMRLNALTMGLLLGGLIALSGNTPASAQAPATEVPTPVEVVVNKGDTLTSIADTHQTTYKRIFDKNTNIEHPDVIYVGDKLTIPRADETLVPREVPGAAQPAPAAQPAAVPAPAPAPAAMNGGVWDRLALCESGGNWSINTGNGFYGGLQFTLSSWQAVGGSGYPHLASKAEQIARAERLLAIQGWGAWPACSTKLGLR